VNKKPLFAFTGCCAAGLLCGYSAHRLSTSSAPGADPAALASAAAKSGLSATEAATTSGSPGVPVKRAADSVKSNETLESLKADETNLYTRLATWMLDASQEEIAAYWQHYRTKGNRSNEINDIIFINWTRLDPQAATAAAKGTPDEHYAWWAWACHDPEKALAAAIATNPDRVNNVTWGIGEFHPAWLREHFDELPESSRDNALQGLAKWDDHPDPEATLKFLKDRGYGFHDRLFKVLVQRDPWAAYDWIEENGSTMAGRYGGTMEIGDTFIKNLAEYHPDVLDRVAEMTPRGELKRKMEAETFKSLLASDPEEAIRQAAETKAPYVAAGRFAAAGLAMVRNDPERAFELAAAMLESMPNALGFATTVTFDNGGSSWGSPNAEPGELMQALMASDPRRTMEMLPATDENGGRGFELLASTWVARDMEGYCEWLNEIDDENRRDQGAMLLVSHLKESGNNTEAADWAKTIGPGMEHHLGYVLRDWGRINPDEVKRWVESSGLTESQYNAVKRYLPEEP
jgi:hypothetical protein